eukprot:188993-Chlamydomonas_euryale.AAC.1
MQGLGGGAACKWRNAITLSLSRDAGLPHGVKFDIPRQRQAAAAVARSARFIPPHKWCDASRLSFMRRAAAPSRARLQASGRGGGVDDAGRAAGGVGSRGRGGGGFGGCSLPWTLLVWAQPRKDRRRRA